MVIAWLLKDASLNVRFTNYNNYRNIIRRLKIPDFLRRLLRRVDVPAREDDRSLLCCQRHRRVPPQTHVGAGHHEGAAGQVGTEGVRAPGPGFPPSGK